MADSFRASTAPAAVMGPPLEPKRKLSLASELETMSQSGAFLRAVQEDRPEVAVCRAILQKRPGWRSLDDIHVLKSLLSTSKLLEFFSNLDAYKIDKLYQSIEVIVFDEKGGIVFEEDDPGENFCMVFRGQVEIRKRDPLASIDVVTKKPVTTHIATLGSGDSFGERALLYESDRRAATAVVSSDSAELIFINRNVFTDLLKDSHEADVTGAALEVSKRFRSNKDIIRNIFMRPSAQRSEKDLKFAVEYLNSVKFFARFSFEVRKQLCKAMKLISAVTNTVIFEEGQVGRHFYIIFSGSTEVSVRTKNRFDETSENVVSRLGEGEYFGELALSETGGLRRATVRCTDFCELLVLGRDQYEPLIKKYQNEYHAQYAKMLSKNPYFIGPEWDDYTIQAMCAVMAEKYFPFKGEICKQGSRATEMFIITRGECIMVHEGKHPITGHPQQYELGRFGPNSVLGCAEASSGRFNDIYTRDYSIIAESPVRLLVLSRFDIFHLMSSNARESLQRSSAGNVRESIESRAIKSVTWERYRKEFLADVLTRRDCEARQGIGGGRGPGTFNRLSISVSTPTLGTAERVLKPLIEPGSLVLEPRQGRVRARKVGKVKKIPDMNNAFDVPTKTTEEAVSITSEPDPIAGQRRRTVQEDSGTRRRHLLTTSDEAPVDDAASHSSPTPCVDDETEREEISNMAIRQPARGRRKSMVKSKTCAILESMAPFHQPPISRLPDNFQEKPLYGSSSLPSAIAISPPSSASSPSAPSSVGRRRSVRLRSDAALGNRQPSALLATSVIWTPVHGACQPFALLGFLRERERSKPAAAASAKPSHSSSSGPQSAASIHKHVATGTTEHSESGFSTVVAFRVFGKFSELCEALDMFRHVCSLERTPPSPERDSSRFVVYKEDEMTMIMENYFGDAAATPYQYRALDVPQPTGQRYACVSVSVESPTRIVENVAVHVYQCFPTPQSAVRFAKQMVSASLATLVLSVVPLFEWVPLAEIDRFDAKNADLEQALESVSLRAAERPLSTWKARKEAVKKARVHALKRS